MGHSTASKDMKHMKHMKHFKVLRTFVAIAVMGITAVISQHPSSSSAATLTPDQVQLVQIANWLETGAPGTDSSYVTHMAIVGQFALVGYWDKKNTGEEFLASKTSGQWLVLMREGGAMNAAEIMRFAPQINSATASALVSQVYPVWNG